MSKLVALARHTDHAPPSSNTGQEEVLDQSQVGAETEIADEGGRWRTASAAQHRDQHSIGAPDRERLNGLRPARSAQRLRARCACPSRSRSRAVPGRMGFTGGAGRPSATAARSIGMSSSSAITTGRAGRRWPHRRARRFGNATGIVDPIYLAMGPKTAR